MNLKPTQYKKTTVFLLVIGACFSSVWQAGGVGTPGLSSEANPAIRGQAISVLSPPETRLAYSRRVLFAAKGFQPLRGTARFFLEI